VDRVSDHGVRYHQITLLETLYNIYTMIVMLVKTIAEVDLSGKIGILYNGIMFYLNMVYIPDVVHYLIRYVCLHGGTVVFDLEPIYTEGGKSHRMGMKTGMHKSTKNLKEAGLKNLASQGFELAKEELYAAIERAEEGDAEILNLF